MERYTLIVHHKPQQERKTISWSVYYELDDKNRNISWENHVLYVKEVVENLDSKEASERQSIIDAKKYQQIVDEAKQIRIPVMLIGQRGILMHAAYCEIEIPQGINGYHRVKLGWYFGIEPQWDPLTTWVTKLMDFFKGELTASA